MCWGRNVFSATSRNFAAPSFVNPGFWSVMGFDDVGWRVALVHQVARPPTNADGVRAALIGDAGVVEPGKKVPVVGLRRRGQADYRGEPASATSSRIPSSSYRSAPLSSTNSSYRMRNRRSSYSIHLRAIGSSGRYRNALDGVDAVGALGLGSLRGRPVRTRRRIAGFGVFATRQRHPLLGRCRLLRRRKVT